MNFNSLAFLIFLPVVLLLYWVLPHRFRWVLLLVASYYFYMSWNPWLIFLILATTLVSYLSALFMGKSEKKGWKRFWLIFTIVVCIGSLIFFKYFNFLIKSATDFLNLFSLHINSFSLDIVLPIGISFYTFQTLSYVIDVYRGKFEAERHIGYYALFVCYFPQLVAGPIERPKDLIPQLKQEHRFDLDDFFVGLRILLVGFFYKCAVADVFGIFVNKAFADVSSGNTLSMFLTGFLFTIQMYCDFAGYSEIATGAARMMGVKLSRNFNRPYMCTSYSDFFRRWHITLTR
ncbi:MAG: MBOAT family protein [Bacilli bacterium]|nr:MBOAT family protein [Bacilli bacterium]